MKKILAAFLILLALLSVLVSCGSIYKDVNYKENGIAFTLPNTMRRVTNSDYDFYFTNTVVVFTANELDEEYYEELSLDPNMTAKEYLDHLMKSNNMDLDQMEYKYDSEKNIHNFRYTSESEENNLFYYVVITGEPGNIWYIEMCCEEDYYEDYLSTFGEWKRSIYAYNETE